MNGEAREREGGRGREGGREGGRERKEDGEENEGGKDDKDMCSHLLITFDGKHLLLNDMCAVPPDGEVRNERGEQKNEW